MCGINGVFAYRGTRPVSLDTLRRTRDFMVARGPDAFGEWHDESRQIALGHRRLSIIDLSDAGAQPMASADGRLVVTFNGEIYNFRALRQELEDAGCVFKSESDTEILLHLYRREGAGMIRRLRGMFAFGLWDADRRSLLIARDPYGIKPFYYADDGACIQFASSVKALMAGGDVSREPEPAGIVGFSLFGSVPEPWTTYRAIKSLPAGCYAMIDAQGVSAPRTYFSLAATYMAAEREPLPMAQAAEAFKAAALESLRHHLVSDVPVGAFLSGGVDSGSLVGLMRDAGQNSIRTVTLAFEAFRGTPSDESPLAESVARHYATEHTTRWVSAAEFMADLPRIIEAMDQPSIDGINTWFVSKATRELGLKVAISGIGGDELLGGYSTFNRLPRMVRAMRLLPNLRGSERLIAAVVAAARRFGVRVHPKAAGLIVHGGTFAGAYMMLRSVYTPSELGEVMRDPNVIAEGLARLAPLDAIGGLLTPEPHSDFARITILESGFYMRNQLLRDTDWAGMAHSLEIRTPLVDSELLRAIAPMFVGADRPDGKKWLAEAPRKPLSPEIVNRPKTGFAIPIRNWYEPMGASPDNSSAGQWQERLWSRTWVKSVSGMFGLSG